MNTHPDLFRGQWVRLARYLPADAEIMAVWTENAEYMRLVDTDPARPSTVEQVQGQYGHAGGHNSFLFTLRTLADDRLIGFVALFNIEWNNGSGTMAIGIGQPEDWGRGFGSDALALILRYAFGELNLHRLGLDVIANNPRALRAYEKAGFHREGVLREAVHRDGVRHDRIMMGMLRREWEAQRGADERLL